MPSAVLFGPAGGTGFAAGWPKPTGGGWDGLCGRLNEVGDNGCFESFRARRSAGIRGSAPASRRCAAGPGAIAFASWRRWSSFVGNNGVGDGGGGNAGAESRNCISTAGTPEVGPDAPDGA